MTFREIAHKLADSEVSEVRSEQIREIARAFGVPPAILFETSRATWLNYEQSRGDFLNGTPRPWLSRWAAAYTRCLIAPGGRPVFVIEAVATIYCLWIRATAFTAGAVAGRTAAAIRQAVHGVRRGPWPQWGRVSPGEHHRSGAGSGARDDKDRISLGLGPR